MAGWVVKLTNNKGDYHLLRYPRHETITDDAYHYYKIGLKPGTYRLELIPEFEIESGSFEIPFIVNFTATEYFEKEYNSTKQSANQIELDKT